MDSTRTECATQYTERRDHRKMFEVGRVLSEHQTRKFLPLLGHLVIRLAAFDVRVDFLCWNGRQVLSPERLR